MSTDTHDAVNPEPTEADELDLHRRRNQFITDSAAAYDDTDPGETATLLAEARRAR